MPRKPHDDRTPRDAKSLRERLWPHQRAALDLVASGAKFDLPDAAGRSHLGNRDFDVMVEDEAFYTRTVLLPHPIGAPPADPIPEAIALAGAPSQAPDDWDLASSACKQGYGAEVNPDQDHTAVALTAKMVVSRNVVVAAVNAPSSLNAAIDACTINWPREVDGWTFSSRRGLEAFDAEPIEIDPEPLEPLPEQQLPGMGM